MNFIGDVAGQYDALLRLIAKMPEDDVILLGDIVDRGPKSKEVIEWAMSNPKVQVIMGNHEHMMIHYCTSSWRYQKGIWMHNGGDMTLRSYETKKTNNPRYGARKIPKEHIQWLQKLPWYIEGEYDGIKVLCTHAPLRRGKNLDSAQKITADHELDASILWNRSPDIEDIPGTLSIFGHNSHWGVRSFNRSDGSTYALCLDDSNQNHLTGFSSKTKNIYHEKFDLEDV